MRALCIMCFVCAMRAMLAVLLVRAMRAVRAVYADRTVFRVRSLRAVWQPVPGFNLDTFISFMQFYRER